MPLPLLSFIKKLRDVWGREGDQDSWSWGKPTPPQENPDETTSDEYYGFSLNPQVVAGMADSDVSQYFVSARGIEDKKTGAYFPPQLMWTTPELENDEILDLVGWQFDEEFVGGFSETIRSTDSVCKSYGHTVIEYEWYIRDREPFKDKAFVKMAYARDPNKYKYDIGGKSGIYQDTGFGKYKRMNPQNFQSYAYNPLFNNPYGTSINLPLKSWLETFTKIFGYWRHALEKAGMGSWVAHGKDSWFLGKNNKVGQAEITNLKNALKAIASGTYTVFPESAQLKNEKLQMEAEAFLNWYTVFCEIVSLIHTGTTGALKEEEYGSRAAKESTDVRTKSQKEMFNAARVSAFWTGWFIPLLCAVNFRPSHIRSTPTLQLIPPNLIMPTTPEGQDTAEEVTEKGEQEEIEVKSKKTEDPQELMRNAETLEERCVSKHQKTSVRCTLKKGHMSFHLGTDDSQWTDFEPIELQEKDELVENDPPIWLTDDPNVDTSQLDNIFCPFDRINQNCAETDFVVESELQEEDEEKPYTPPVAVPPTYEDFPNTDPLPPDYRDVIDGAQSYLESMPVKPYPDVQPEEAHQVFTIRKFRSFEKDKELLQQLKLAIIPTLEANTEDTAWKLYWQQAIKIFQDYGFEQPSPQLRSSLIASFRQARQNALNEGLYQSIIDDPAVVGLRLKEDPHVKEHHLDEIAWKDIAIPKEHKELQLGGRLRIPLNFGCLHHYEKVYDPAKLTPEADWPKEFPGETYKYYAQPEPKGEE